MEVVKPWEGTPWRAGQCCIGVGVDCIHFGVSVMDALFRLIDPPPIPRLSQDTSLHNESLAWEVVSKIMRRYGKQGVDFDLIEGNEVEPGDMLIYRVGRGPGHLAIVGPEPGTIWHAQRPQRVMKTQLNIRADVLRVYRPRNKAQWV